MTSTKLPRRIHPAQRVVAITGSASFLGSQLLKRLSEDPRYVRLISVDIRQLKTHISDRVEHHTVDLTQPTSGAHLARLFSEANVDTVVHLAFLGNPTHQLDWAHEFETIGTLHILNAAAACRVAKVIVWSQSILYGPHAENPFRLNESAPLRGIAQTPFFDDKLEVERLIERFEQENSTCTVTMLRTAPILGRHIGNLVSRYFQRTWVPVLAGYDPLMQLLHEEDAISAFKLVADADFPGTYNIASKDVLPLRTLIALAGKFPLPIPLVAATQITNLLWLTQLSLAPAPFLSFLRYACIAETKKSEETLGFRPRYDIRAVVNDFVTSPSRESLQARFE